MCAHMRMRSAGRYRCGSARARGSLYHVIYRTVLDYTYTLDFGLYAHTRRSCSGREMDAILQADLSSVRTPQGGDRVYKDECIYSFQTPVHAWFLVT